MDSEFCECCGDWVLMKDMYSDGLCQDCYNEYDDMEPCYD